MGNGVDRVYKNKENLRGFRRFLKTYASIPGLLRAIPPLRPISR